MWTFTGRALVMAESNEGSNDDACSPACSGGRVSSAGSSGDPVLCSTGHRARTLDNEEIRKLESDKVVLNAFKRNKIERESQKSWDLFYKRNTTRFYKDRHWTTREFEELCGDYRKGKGTVILEAGCGVGNFMFPLLEENPGLFFYACDFSQRAVDFVKDNPQYHEEHCKAFQCDVTADALTDAIPTDSVDIATLIFVLSAIHPNKMVQSLKNIYTVLKPGGCVLIRDYGMYDYAMLRFKQGHKLQENLYVRQDNTRAYYFSEEELERLFGEAGFDTEKKDYVLRKTVNHKEGLSVPRVFVQGKFVKIVPIEEQS